ncbi:MAG: carboxymuconolactone decarboxylase family protein [Burkholderiales bacterium]|nr:carboxymuconolactone decarboxylase family protein [Burkholderiales bacterium]
MDENPKFKAGLAVRKAVLGEEYVNQALANANADEFMASIQQLITENAWGTVWTREGLDRKTRSLLNLAMLTALNRPNELKLHLKGALNNGVSKDEIREVFLQAAVYCGAPAGLDSFKIAQQVFKEEAAKG